MNQHPLLPTSVASQFEIGALDVELSEEVILETLSERIAYMMEHNLDYLLSLMYRLDIEEADLQSALHRSATEAPHIALAKLVLKRQKQRIQSRIEHQIEQKTDKWAWDF